MLYQRILLLQISLYFCNEIALYLFFHFSIDLVFETFKQKTQANMSLGGRAIKIENEIKKKKVFSHGVQTRTVN